MKSVPIPTRLVLVALATCCFCAVPSHAQSAMTYSPLTGTGVGPSGPASAKIKTEPYCCPSTALLVKATQPVGESDFQWVDLGLSVPGSLTGRRITGVEVCYQIQAPPPDTTYISQTRLTDMTKPNAALVRLDDPTNRTAAGPACYSVRASFVAKGTVTLSLKVVFSDTRDEIRLGMVRLLF